MTNPCNFEEILIINKFTLEESPLVCLTNPTSNRHFPEPGSPKIKSRHYNGGYGQQKTDLLLRSAATWRKRRRTAPRERISQEWLPFRSPASKYFRYNMHISVKATI